MEIVTNITLFYKKKTAQYGDVRSRSGRAKVRQHLVPKHTALQSRLTRTSCNTEQATLANRERNLLYESQLLGH